MTADGKELQNVPTYVGYILEDEDENPYMENYYLRILRGQSSK